jgi:hypothetical protein
VSFWTTFFLYMWKENPICWYVGAPFILLEMWVTMSKHDQDDLANSYFDFRSFVVGVFSKTQKATLDSTSDIE